MSTSVGKPINRVMGALKLLEAPSILLILIYRN